MVICKLDEPLKAIGLKASVIPVAGTRQARKIDIRRPPLRNSKFSFDYASVRNRRTSSPRFLRKIRHLLCRSTLSREPFNVSRCDDLRLAECRSATLPSPTPAWVARTVQQSWPPVCVAILENNLVHLGTFSCAQLQRRRSKWLVLTVSPACFPMIEISKWLVFDPLRSQTPAVEMAGFSTPS
jgi:hypothetical protein